MIDVDDIDRYGCDRDEPSSSFSKEVEIYIGDTEITVEIHLDCVRGSEPERGRFGPPELYDPGGPADFELDYAVVSVENRSNGIDTAKLTADLFWALLGDKAQLVYDAAIEAAQESGEF
jgi:hypothetical protein